jgi:hypothetical protein
MQIIFLIKNLFKQKVYEGLKNDESLKIKINFSVTQFMYNP